MFKIVLIWAKFFEFKKNDASQRKMMYKIQNGKIFEFEKKSKKF